MEKRKIDLFEAIERMKTISAAGDTFALKFRKYNRATRTGGDMASVSHARLRPKASDEDVENSSYKLYFTDTDTGRPLNCWQPLIMEFNGIETTLN